MIRLPFLHKKSAVPLTTCLQKAARDAGMSEYAIAAVMSHFLEAVADEVAKGRPVSIPGFGMFVQTTIVRGCRRYYRPGFIPARPFRNQVRLGTRMSPDAIKTKNTYYENQRGSMATDKGDRTFTVMAEFRRLISAQLKA